MIIEPTEKRDQHCKIYVEKSLKKELDRYATKNHLSFSEAGRKLLINALENSVYSYSGDSSHSNSDSNS